MILLYFGENERKVPVMGSKGVTGGNPVVGYMKYQGDINRLSSAIHYAAHWILDVTDDKPKWIKNRNNMTTPMPTKEEILMLILRSVEYTR